MSITLSFNPDAYVASPELIKAFGRARATERVLLLRGEPGCGKTRFAHYISKELGLGEPYELIVRSRSTMEDALYRYDAIGRLHNMQLYYHDKSTVLKDKNYFIKYGPLGQAIKNADKKLPKGKRQQRVLLIDEIDKADIDFPNDLLRPLENSSFEVEEIEYKYEAHPDFRPIVIVTSNEEKPLPDAFLRRCVDYYIEFPKEHDLAKILHEHFKELATAEDNAQLIKDFVSRRESVQKFGGRAKLPGTSELIDVRRLINADTTAAERDELLRSGVVLKGLDAELRASLLGGAGK